jgi:hypothetical protein
MNHPALAKLEAALPDRSDVYVPLGVDEKSYIEGLANSIRTHTCTPFPVSATVMPPGFPDASPGSIVSGHCVAHHAGHWLVFSLECDRFYCFWGNDPTNLGAHGVSGSPLHCWSA